MSNKHPNLEEYLASRRATDDRYAHKTLNTRTEAMRGGNINLNMREEMFQAEHESWKTNFFDSKRECLNELRRIRERIANE